MMWYVFYLYAGIYLVIFILKIKKIQPFLAGLLIYSVISFSCKYSISLYVALLVKISFA